MVNIVTSLQVKMQTDKKEKNNNNAAEKCFHFQTCHKVGETLQS